ncbi:hypothetical protein TNCV_4253351 [Trichonephila clavipes]|nr:hypothetical protein TNCV_4253351 [Trichonephila clavipes]
MGPDSIVMDESHTENIQFSSPGWGYAAVPLSSANREQQRTEKPLTTDQNRGSFRHSRLRHARHSCGTEGR